MNIVRLSVPAPRREWYPTANGWASRAWTPEARAEAAQGGAWFGPDTERAESLTGRGSQGVAACRCDKHKRS